MRYRGGGVGHKSTRAATDIFLKDRDKLDTPDHGVDASSSEDELEHVDNAEDDNDIGNTEHNDVGNTEDNYKDVNDSAEKAEDGAKEMQTDDGGIKEDMDGIGLDQEESDGSTEDEDCDIAVFEEEYDYGYCLDPESEASDAEGQEAEEINDALGPEDSGNGNEEDPDFADF